MKTLRTNLLLLAFAVGALMLIGGNVLGSDPGESEYPGGEVKYNCRCGLISDKKTCQSNNWGSRCAPQGTALCRDFDANCGAN